MAQRNRRNNTRIALFSIKAVVCSCCGINLSRWLASFVPVHDSAPKQNRRDTFSNNWSLHFVYPLNWVTFYAVTIFAKIGISVNYFANSMLYYSSALVAANGLLGLLISADREQIE